MNHGLLCCFEYDFNGANKNSYGLYRTEIKDLASHYLWKKLILLKRQQVNDLKLRVSKLVFRNSDQRGCLKLKTDYLLDFILNDQYQDLYTKKHDYIFL